MKETKRTFEKVFAALGLLIGIEGHALAAGSSTAQPPSRPNIVVFTGDDMDYSTMNSNGCPVLGLTPNMDRLASQGILLEQAHVPNGGLSALAPIHDDWPASAQERIVRILPRPGGYSQYF